MSEDQELQARIAALSGRINHHKRQSQDINHIQKPYNNSYGRGRGDSSWGYRPGTPYGAPRGRGGRGGATHRNRTLVLNSTSNSVDQAQNGSPSTETQATNQSGPKFVAKVDRHLQLINTSIYDKVSQQRVRSMAETAVNKSRQQDLQEKAKLDAHFKSIPSLPSHSTTSSVGNERNGAIAHELLLDGIAFRVIDGGSKLVRAANDTNRGIPTPKQAYVGGVRFFRSKNGNLYRAGLVKATKSGPPIPCGRYCSRHSRKRPINKVSELCPNFTSTGSLHLPYYDILLGGNRFHDEVRLYLVAILTDLIGQCAKGPTCRFLHDAHKVAICKDFLAKGSCVLGDACDLSHEPNAHRVPACLHFIRGNCTNENCRYAHVRVNPGASVCRAFAKLGYCDKGISCAERHVNECPDYANKGLCRNKKCRLPHVDRAGQIRKATAANAEQATAMDVDNSSDLSSDGEEYDSEDFDSDNVEEFFGDGQHGDTSGDVSQQRDFIQF